MRRLPDWTERPWIFVLYVAASTPVTIFLGLRLGAYLLPLVQAAVVFPAYFFLLRSQRWKETCLLMLLWAILTAGTVGWGSYRDPEFMADRVLLSRSYQAEMFHWIETGMGREGEIRQFLPQHLLHLGLFSALTLISGGFLGLGMGAVLLNYMSFYVGTLLRESLEPEWVLLLAWPPWAVLRVVGFILVAMVLSALVYRWWTGMELDRGRLRRFLAAGLGLLLLDILLKWWLAPFWQQWLQASTRL